MQFLVSATIFSILTDLSWSQAISVSPKDDSQISTVKSEDVDLARLAVPEDQALHEAQAGETQAHVVELRAPHSVTKLAKTIAYGFDPYFKKGYFEPFERRPKLVTLITFRKNGLMPKKSVQESQEKELDVAELQSPFNSVSDH